MFCANSEPILTRRVSYQRKRIILCFQSYFKCYPFENYNKCVTLSKACNFAQHLYGMLSLYVMRCLCNRYHLHQEMEIRNSKQSNSINAPYIHPICHVHQSHFHIYFDSSCLYLVLASYRCNACGFSPKLLALLLQLFDV